MSSREDRGRYRGRRRAPTPPRTRYAAVVTTAFVGAGMVALGTASVLPDFKVDPAALSASSDANALDAARQATADRANRADDRMADSQTSDQVAADLWLLPLKRYTVSTPFGQHDGTLHPGIDLAADEGTPYYAAHGGVVTLARYDGGFGYCVMVDIGGGITMVYGHSAKLVVHEGQKVQAGDMLGLVGHTGWAFGDQLHFEIRVKDQPVNPTTYLQQFGLDIAHGSDALTG